MKSRTFITYFLLFLSVLLFLLPADYLTRFKLNIRSLKAHADEYFGTSLNKPNSNDDSDKLPLRKRITELSAELEAKDLQIAELRAQLNQISEVRAYLPKVKVTPATIIEMSGGALADVFTVNRGSDDLVSPGSAVLSSKYLVGRIAKIGTKVSFVQAISAPGCVIPARAGVSRERCMVFGDGNGQAYVRFHSSISKAVKGEMIVTSGYLGAMQKNILIGKLADTPYRGREPNTLEAPITLGVVPALLENAIIITKSDKKHLLKEK